MFGYVVVNKPELKIKDFDTYRSFYCGLCRSLHHEYGRRGQVALNYDMTFLAVLLSGLYEPESVIGKHHCICHPLHKQMALENEFSTYAGDMTIVLTYLKCQDDWQDEHKYTRLGYRVMLEKRFARISEKYPEKIKNIVSYLKEINDLENEKCYDLDKISTLFGKTMGEIFVYRDDVWKNKLYEMGMYLGKFIYILDAYDDIEEDKKKGQFNPFVKDVERDDFEERAKEILDMMIARSSEVFETLPILAYVDILRNILYSGVWTKYEMIKKKRLGEQDGSI